MIKKISQSKNWARNLYWSLVAILTLVNSTVVSLGFHEHHDGLMLSTIRLAKNSLLSGGEYPFNQYGSFWIAPYLGISLVTPDAMLLASMRLVTFFLYVLTGLYTYKIASQIFNVRVAKISVLFFILAHPIGLEPIPWPSSVSMYLTVLLVWLVIRENSSVNRDTTRFYLAAAGAVSVMNLLTRVQIGFLSILVILIYLVVARKMHSLYFIYGATGFSLLYGLLLAKLGWLTASLSDQFFFGWNVATNSATDRTIPKTSLVLLVVLLLFVSLFLKLRKRSLAPKMLIVLGTYVFVLSLVLSKFALSSFPTVAGKIWVSVLLFTCLLGFLQLIKALQGGRYAECLLIGLGFAAASQIYPLFDVMHAWWGLVPIVILLANQLDKVITRHGLYLVMSPAVAVLSVLLIASHLSGISKTNAEVDSRDLRFIRLDHLSSLNYKQESEFFERNIKNGSSVLNLCQDGRIFFRPNFVQSESRYFVYWPIMQTIDSMRDSLLRSKPDYVVKCTHTNSDELTGIEKEFTSAPYSLVDQFNDTDKTVKIYKVTAGR
jgi:hypothetical protein